MNEALVQVTVLAFQLALAVVTWRKAGNGHAKYPDNPATHREVEHIVRDLGGAVQLAVVSLRRAHEKALELPYAGRRDAVTDYLDAAEGAIPEWAERRKAKVGRAG